MRFGRCLLLLLWTWCAGFAQEPGGARKFEVASVKVSPADPAGRERARRLADTGNSDPGRFSRQNDTLFNLILFAYNLLRHQLLGPPWLETEHYDITAKVPPGATKDNLRAMARNLLAERFRLTAHTAKKEMPVYELVVARGGPKLKEWVPDPTAEADTRPPDGPVKFATDPQGFPILPSYVGSLTTRVNGQWVSSMQGRESMAEFAARLSGYAGRPVNDGTGLSGKYEFNFHWMTDATPVSQSTGAVVPKDGAALPAASEAGLGITLFSALQTQLGLKLEPAKAMVDVLTIDHVEKAPTGN